MQTLRVNGLTKTYEWRGQPVHAVRDVSFEASSGEVVALLGPSGSGKTTLLAMIGALLSPTMGTIEVVGQEIGGLGRAEQERYRRTTVGYVFQANNLLQYLTARENLLYVAHLAGVPKAVASQRADDLLASLDLGARANALGEDLSGGERQRTAIARAFMNDPAVLLLDEPTANLDSERTEALLQLLVTQVRERNNLALVVTHDPLVAERADRVLTLRDGRLLG